MSSETEYRLIIPGRPVPKGRPRMSRHGHTYTPKRTKEHERKISDLCRVEVIEPISQPVSIIAKFYINGRNYADLDNYVKSLLDGLQPYCIVNDKQVQRITAERLTTSDKHNQRTEVLIRRL